MRASESGNRPGRSLAINNALGAYGYNRDGKKGKKQIVIGLLCDEEGAPVSTEVFRGNTQDPQTFGAQVRKASQRFGCQRVTFVGDRGMIKSGQIEELAKAGFHYITAITKPQIDTLLSGGVLQMALFDDSLCEVEQDSVRYVLRRNPVRAEEIAATRAGKQASVAALLQERNQYLAEHAKAKVSGAEKGEEGAGQNRTAESRSLVAGGERGKIAEARRRRGGTDGSSAPGWLLRDQNGPAGDGCFQAGCA